MAQTPEGKVKAKITAILKKHGVYYFMPVQMGLGNKTLDYLCCHKGKFIGIEAKREDGEPTALQLATMREIMAAGGHAMVISNGIGLETLDRLLGAN